MNKRFVNRILLVLVSLTTLYLLTTCAKKIINDNNTTGIEFKIAVEYSTAELADLIVKYRVTISASDMETITATLEEKDGVVRGEVKDVPEGSGRNILLEALDEKDTVIYAGSVDTSIVAGQTVTVKILLEPVVRMVRLAPKFSSAQSTDSFTVEVRACNIGEPSEFELVVKNYPPSVIVMDVVGDYVAAWHHGIYSDTPQVKIDVVVDPIPSQTGDDPWCLGLATLVCSCRVADICVDTAGLSVEVITLNNDSAQADLLYEDGMAVTIGGYVLDVTPNTLSFRIPAPGPYLHGVFSIVESCGNGDIPYNLAIDESDDWFSISSQSGLTPAVCTVGIKTAGMEYETSYFDSIRVGSQLATDTSYVHVLLEIGQCPPPLPPGSPVGQIGHLYGDTVATLIMWLQSGSPDVAGYNVYKSSGDSAFMIINDSLITQNPMDPSYGNFLHIDYDLNTTSQVRLRYYVTAVSDSGCESSNSDTITFIPADISDSSQTHVQNLQPMDGWFASDVPTFTWNSEPGAESYMILLTPVTPGNDPCIWLYRHIDTSFQLGEQLGMTYMPLATAHSPLVGGQLYRFQVYPINSDRAVYRWGEATFEAVGPEGFLGITECDPPGAEDSRDWRNHGSTRYGVAPACPNPASTPIGVGLSNMDDGTLDWYVLGSLSDTVKVGQSSFMPAGHHYFDWDLKDDDSIRLDPGIYRFCLRINDFQTYGDIQVLDYSDTVPAPTSPLGLMGYTEHGDTIMTVFMWIEPDYHDIAGYNVYKSVGGGVFDTLNDSLITENPIDPAWPNCLWADYGVDTSSTVVHEYYIKTVNSAGSESETSDTISFVPAVLWQAMHGEGGPWIENLRPRDGLFGSTSPTFSWDPVTGNQGYLMMLRPTSLQGDEQVMWLYRSNATSTQLGETGGLTYIPLEYSPLIAGTYYLFVVFAVNSDNTVYMTSDGSTFEVIGPDGFTGITRTYSYCDTVISGDLLDTTITCEYCVVDSSEVDTTDWCEDCGSGGPLPSQFCMPPACPNPANDLTEINLGLPVGSDYTMYIIDNIDADFAIIDSISGYYDAGMLTIEWGLTDSNGVKLDTGIYRCLIEAGDFSCWGDIRITDCTILSAPGLVSPINGDTGVSHTPTLIWHDVDGADNYEVEVDTDSTFTDSPASGYIADTTVVAQIPISDTVYWHVRAQSSCDTSDWSETWHFVTTGSDPCTTVWNAADAGLEAAVRDHINKPTDTVWVCDVDTITSLDAGNRNISDLGGIQYLASLDWLELYNNQITGISPLAGLTSLGSLNLGVNQITDLSPLAGLSLLRYLNLDNNQITDLSPLAGLDSLQKLLLEQNQITDLSPLAGLTSLDWLYLENNQITDISPLDGLTSLSQLSLNYNQIIDLSPLVLNVDFASGDILSVANNPLSDSSISIHIATLKARGVSVGSNYLVFDPDTLYFSADSGGTNPAAQQVLVSEAGNVDSLDYTMSNYPSWIWLTNPSDTTPGSTMVYVDITGLSVGGYFDSIWVQSDEAYDSLVFVYCSLVVSDPDAGLVFPDTGLEGAIRDHISKPTGTIYVSDVDTITSLDASYRNISNLGGIQYLTALDTLNLYNNPIDSISPLAGLSSLSYLDLGINLITDISPLAGLDSLEFLSLDLNQIADIGPLAGMTSLDMLVVEGNNIADISPLVDNAGIDAGDNVYIYGNPLSDSSIQFHIPTLTARGVTVYSNHIRFDPYSLNFGAPMGGPNPVPETLRVFEAGGQQVLYYTISETIPWCTVVDPMGFTPETTAVNVDISGLAVGHYLDTLWITSGDAYNSPETVLVNLHISDTITAAFSLDSVSGASGSTIPTGQEVTFYIHMKGDDSTWGTISNGFRVYSPDGAQWDTTMADTISHGWYPGMFNLGFWINSFSADGLAADTVVFAGTILSTPGLPAWFDETAYTLTIGPISPSDHGKTICLDSCWYPPAGNWFWQTLGGYRIAPGWDGPHCFTIDSGGVACGNVDGVVGGWPVDVADLAYLNEYLFQGGPAPPSYVAANMDLCDNVDIGDEVYLIEYLFTGGNPPCGGSVDCGFAPSGDSVELVVIRRPDVTTGNDTLQLDLYVRNGQNLYGGSVGFSWDNANMQMYNATATSLVTTAFTLGSFLYEDNSIDTTNSQRHFLFGGSGLASNLAADPNQARLWASYYFTLSSWNASDSIVIDTLTFNDGSTYKLVNDSLNGYAPAWKGRLVIKDTSVTSFYGYVIETGGSPLSSALVKLRYVAPAGPVINMDTTNGIGYFEFANITTEPFVIDVLRGGYYPSKTIDVTLDDKGMVSVLVALGSVTPTAEWVTLYCDSAYNPQFGGYPLQQGDIVEAYDPDGVLCGQIQVGTEGHYGYMSVFRDDVATPGVDEGCVPGDTIYVYVNGVQVTPDLVPVWTAHGNSHEACF